MEITKEKIKFYSLGSEKIDISKIKTISEIDSNPIYVSKGFNKALKKVIENDIVFLDKKVNKVLNNIKVFFEARDIRFDVSDYLMIGDIENLVVQMENSIRSLNEEKKNNKIGLFTFQKKEKKLKLKNIEECINYLKKCETDIKKIKNEYNKLNKKQTLIAKENNEKDETEEKEDPLERTIKFYMNKTN